MAAHTNMLLGFSLKMKHNLREEATTPIVLNPVTGMRRLWGSSGRRRGRCAC